MYNSVWGGVSRGEWIFFLVVLLMSILLHVLFLLNLRNLLREVGPQNRAMSPNLVWLNFIPFFSYVWMILTVVKIKDSVEAEFRTRGSSSTKDPSYGVGMGFAVLSIVGAALAWAASGLFVWLSLFVGLALLVLWVVYWVMTAGIKRQLRYMKAHPDWARGEATPAPASHPAAPAPGGESTATECPSCGLLPMPDDEFCRSCGLPIEKPEEPAQDSAAAVGAASSDATSASDTADAVDRTCPYCGEVYRPNAKFCWSCGRPAP